MTWCYEIRGSENRLVDICSGFSTQKEARNAGQRMKRMINCFCFPNLEMLSVITKESPEAHCVPLPNLQYPWERLVFDAFLEPNRQNLPRKMNIAERAISARLLDSAPSELDEHIALREALLALRRLLCEMDTEHRDEPEETDEIA